MRHPRPLIQLSVSVQRPRGEIGIAVVVESETIIAQSSGQRRRVGITEGRCSKRRGRARCLTQIEIIGPERERVVVTSIEGKSHVTCHETWLLGSQNCQHYTLHDIYPCTGYPKHGSVGEAIISKTIGGARPLICEKVEPS